MCVGGGGEGGIKYRLSEQSSSILFAHTSNISTR